MNTIQADRVFMRVNSKLPTLLILITLLFAGPAYSKDQKVKFELADMLEAVVIKTNFRLNISDMTFTSVNISTINDRDVCSKEAKNDVKLLQEAFNNHPNIYNNIGPYLVTFSYKDSSRKIGDLTELRKKGILKGCTNIFVSVH